MKENYGLLGALATGLVVGAAVLVGALYVVPEENNETKANEKGEQ